MVCITRPNKSTNENWLLFNGWRKITHSHKFLGDTHEWDTYEDPITHQEFGFYTATTREMQYQIDGIGKQKC